MHKFRIYNTYYFSTATVVTRTRLDITFIRTFLSLPWVNLFWIFMQFTECEGKSVPLQAWSGTEGSRKLRFPDFVTTAQDGGKVVILTYRPPLPPGSAPGTHFCQRLSRPQGHSAIGRIMLIKNSSDTSWDRTSDLPICSTAP